MTTINQIKNTLNPIMINNDINIISMITDYLIDECDICDKKCNIGNLKKKKCGGCDELFWFCIECINNNSCDCCDDVYCENCKENNGYELHKCDNKRCLNNDKYCVDCKNENMGWCENCQEFKCCFKVFRTIDKESNFIYNCENCLKCVFNGY